MPSQESVQVESEEGEFNDVLIKNLTFVAIDRDGYGRVFAETEFLGRISDYDVEKVKKNKPEIVHPSEYRLSDWWTKQK